LNAVHVIIDAVLAHWGFSATKQGARPPYTKNWKTIENQKYKTAAKAKG
jgi:hypothetical protein